MPQSTLGEAAAHTPNQWKDLEWWLDYEDGELSNKLGENPMRQWL